MKSTIPYLLLLLLLSGCRHIDKHKENDYINDKYYIDYYILYHAYGKVSIDSTQRAIDSYLHTYPEQVMGWTFRSRIYLDMGQPDSAMYAYRRALHIKPNYGPALAGLGTLYGSMGQHDSAVSLLSRAIAAGDSSGYTYLNLAITHYLYGDTDAAKHYGAHFVGVDSFDNNLIAHITALRYALGDTIGSKQSAQALNKRNIKDATLDSLLNKQLSGVDFFLHKRNISHR